MPACDEGFVDLEERGGFIKENGGSINWGAGENIRDELQPLLAPARSVQLSHQRHGLHISNDNTPSIVKLSSIRARLMRE